jgi:hypothetical protein
MGDTPHWDWKGTSLQLALPAAVDLDLAADSVMD